MKSYKYDWNKVAIEFARLKCPKDIDKPKISELKNTTYYITMSERKRGKTTNWLLVGLILNKLYGVVPQLLRQETSMTTKSIMSDCMGVVNKFGYPEKITKGRWNHIHYDYMSKRFIYAKINNDGKIEEKDESTLIKVLSIDKMYDYKSGYNAPMGDFIIFDEFLSRKFASGEVENFFHIISTVFRDREDCKVIMIANSVIKNNPYFEELNIRRAIQNLKQGEYKRLQTQKGTRLYVEILGKKTDEKTKNVNKTYFGFDSKSVESITGDTLWEYYNLPRIPKKDEQNKIIDRSFAFEIFENEFIGVNITDKGEIYANRLFNPKGYVLTNCRDDKCRLYGLFNTKFKRFVLKCIELNKVYYSSMEVANDFMAYVRNAVSYDCLD